MKAIHLVLALAALVAFACPETAKAQSDCYWAHCWSVGYYDEGTGQVWGLSASEEYTGWFYFWAYAYVSDEYNNLVAGPSWPGEGYYYAESVVITILTPGYYYIWGDHYCAYYWWEWDYWYDGGSWSDWIQVPAPPPPPPVAYYDSPWYSGRSDHGITISGSGFSENPTTSGCPEYQFNIDWNVTPTQIEGSASLMSILTPCQLDISVQGYTVATIQVELSIPEGDESFAMGQTEMAGRFGARLTPGPETVRFLAREVQEDVTMVDYCHYTGSQYAQLPPKSFYTTWTVDPFNYYAGTVEIYDRIGLVDEGAHEWVLYYEATIYYHGGSCELGGRQTLYINPPHSPYWGHDVGLHVEPGSVYAYRGYVQQDINY